MVFFWFSDMNLLPISWTLHLHLPDYVSASRCMILWFHFSITSFSADWLISPPRLMPDDGVQDGRIDRWPHSILNRVASTVPPVCVTKGQRYHCYYRPSACQSLVFGSQKHEMHLKICVKPKHATCIERKFLASSRNDLPTVSYLVMDDTDHLAVGQRQRY